ncbi:MAG: hypothetical protein R6T90_04660 [Dissulfuribacterales bacterium]
MRTWPIAVCENQLDVINGGLIPTLRMGPAICLCMSARRQVIKIFMDNWPITRFWFLASRPRILPPKSEMLKYPANNIRVLDQADDPHLRTASCAGQRFKQ